MSLLVIAMALGVSVQIRTQTWWLAGTMGVIGLAALALLTLMMRRDHQASK